MSDLIAAKVKGELLERFRDEQEELHEDTTESELVRDLLDRGLRDRRLPLGVRLDLPNRLAAQIEADREPGEDEEEVVQRLLREAVDAREEDVVDAIGGGDELRQLVDAAGVNGEDRRDTIRRLIREAIEAQEEDTIDAIGGSDELRQLVDTARGDGEDRPDAVRRLLREGVRAGTPWEQARTWASYGFIVFLVLFALIAISPGKWVDPFAGGVFLVTILGVGWQFVRAAYWRLLGEGREVSR